MPYLALVFCTVVWGATFPATKVALAQVPPFTFLFARFLLGTLLVFGLLLAWRRLLRCEREDLRMSAIATVFLFVGYATQTVGLRYTSASNSAFITALYVILVPLFLKRFDRRTWISAGLALCGLWYLVDPSVTVNQGDLWTLACAAGFAGHIACLERFSQRSEPVPLLAWQTLFVTLTMGPAMVIESPKVSQLLLTEELVVALMICGVLATGALALQIWAQRFVSAQRVALIFVMEPVCAAVLAWLFLNEAVGPRGWLGSGLILVAVLLGSIGRAVPALTGLERTRGRGDNREEDDGTEVRQFPMGGRRVS